MSIVASSSRLVGRMGIVVAPLLGGCVGSRFPFGTSSNLVRYPPDDLPETGLQGQVPAKDRQSGRSALGYRKGTVLVGQNTISDRGGNLQLATYDHCAYVGNGGVKPNHTLEGIAVLDVTDGSHPTVIGIMSSPAGYSSWEGLKANEVSAST